MRVFIIISSLVMCCYGCKKHKYDNKEQNKEIIQILDQDIDSKKLDLSELIEVSKIIDLETISKSVIGRIDKVIFSHNTFIILDKRSAKSVFLFDERGKYLTKISGSGRGPQEILSPTDIAVDDSSKEIFILDRSLRKINVYNFSGEFRKHINLGFAPTSMEILSNEYLVFVSQGEFHVYVTNREGKIINKYFKADPRFQLTLKTPLIRLNSEILFVRFVDNIYKIDEKEIVTWRVIDFGEQELTREKYINIEPSGMDRLISQNYKYGINALTVSDNHISFYFNYQRKGHFAQLNPHTSKKTIVPGINDNLFGGGVRLITGSWQFNSQFITTIEPSRVNYNQAKYLTDSDLSYDNGKNPLLLIFNFKKYMKHKLANSLNNITLLILTAALVYGF